MHPNSCRFSNPTHFVHSRTTQRAIGPGPSEWVVVDSDDEFDPNEVAVCTTLDELLDLLKAGVLPTDATLQLITEDEQLCIILKSRIHPSTGVTMPHWIEPDEWNMRDASWKEYEPNAWVDASGTPYADPVVYVAWISVDHEEWVRFVMTSLVAHGVPTDLVDAELKREFARSTG